MPPKWNVIIVVQLLSCVQNFEIPWTSAPLSFTTSQSLLRFNIHQVSDAMQPSHLLLSPSPPAFSLSQHQGLLQRVGSLHQVAKVLELQL